MLTCHTCDVFTDRAFAGNPLAIVLGADDLTPARMLTLAREFNLSETIVVQRPANPAHTARVRIFFPTAGIPEDPATGSACAILAAQLLALGALTEGETRLALHQGGDIGLTVVVNGGQLDQVHVAGSAVPVASGRIRVPNGMGRDADRR